MARLGSPHPGPRREQGELRQPGGAPRADRHQRRPRPATADRRRAGGTRGARLRGRRGRRQRAAALGPRRLAPHELDRLQRRARPDPAVGALDGRALDRRPRDDDGGGARTTRRPALPLGQPADLLRRLAARPEAVRAARRALDPQGLSGRREHHRLQQRQPSQADRVLERRRDRAALRRGRLPPGALPPLRARGGELVVRRRPAALALLELHLGRAPASERQHARVRGRAVPRARGDGGGRGGLGVPTHAARRSRPTGGRPRPPARARRRPRRPRGRSTRRSPPPACTAPRDSRPTMRA